jgi:hypothetical protein
MPGVRPEFARTTEAPALVLYAELWRTSGQAGSRFRHSSCSDKGTISARNSRNIGVSSHGPTIWRNAPADSRTGPYGNAKSMGLVATAFCGAEMPLPLSCHTTGSTRYTADFPSSYLRGVFALAR